MARMDTERLIKRFRTILQANLPAKLAAITAEYVTEDAAEYGGSVTLEAIENSNYYINGPPETINAGTFIAMGVDSVQITARGPNFSAAHSVFVAIGHAGLKNDSNWDRIESKMFRYTRSVREVVLENFDKVLPGFAQVEFLEQPAEPILQLETGETLRVSGLKFTATIA